MADEPKVFPPSPEFQKNAYYSSIEQYEADYKRSVEDPEGFWDERAEDALVWTKKWDKVLDWSFDPKPYVKWFEGGELNASYNCLDRHVEAGKGDKAAIIFEGDPGDTKTYTYAELKDEVCKFANVLKKYGVKKGDRVALYLPMIAELPIVMLACARLGAIHMMVFGGFSAEALKARIDNCQAEVLICADKGYRGAKNTPSKTNADAAIAGETTVKKVIVIERVDGDVPMTEGRDVWFHDEMAAPDISTECEPVPVDAEHPLFILYTSGSTGTPKGVIHSTGGTSSMRTTPRNTSSTCTTTTSTSAPPTSAGSQGTATSCTARSPWARPASSSRVSRRIRSLTATGRSSKSTRPPRSTPRRPSSAVSSARATSGR